MHFVKALTPHLCCFLHFYFFLALSLSSPLNPYLALHSISLSGSLRLKTIILQVSKFRSVYYHQFECRVFPIVLIIRSVDWKWHNIVRRQGYQWEQKPWSASWTLRKERKKERKKYRKKEKKKEIKYEYKSFEEDLHCVKTWIWRATLELYRI